MTRALSIVAVVGWLAGSGAVRADDVEEAKAHFRRGVELYRAQRFGDAAEEFEAAYRAKPHGSIHYNVAQCRERLGQWPAAYRAYSDYLHELPDAKDRAAVRASMGKIEERLAKTGEQLLVVYSDPPGARVTVDGVLRGTTPLHLSLAPAAYALALALDGHEPASERVELTSSASRVVDLTLRRAPQPVAAALAPDPGAGHDLSARPQPAEAERVPVAPAPAAPKRLWPVWVAAGTAAAALAAGALFGASAKADAQAISSMGAPDGARASQLAQSAQSKARTANILYGVAGGAAVAAGALYVIEVKF